MHSDNNNIEIKTVDVWGQLIRVGIRPGRGTPLLLFNGVGANLELLTPFVAALDGIETITFDVPGVGGSPLPILPYRFWSLACMVNRMLDKLGYAKVDVLGVSWGGAAAQQFALQYPRRCRKLILAATSTGTIMVPGKLSVISKMASPRRYTEPAYMESIAAELYGGAFKTNPDWIREHTRNVRFTRGRGYYYQLLAGWGWTSILWLHWLRQPTLILAANDDPVVPLANAKLLKARIPNSKLHIVNGGGHLFLGTHAAELAPVIQDFLIDEARAAA